MKNILVMTILTLTTLFALPTASFAQGMMEGSSMLGTASSTADNNHTVIEETRGKDVFNKLQSKQVTCQNLSNDDFEVLGEYFMGQMAGSSHEAMNSMMIKMMGEDSEKQMHIAMGKRLSGCEPDALAPQNMGNMMSMMSMMMNMMGARNFMVDPWTTSSPAGILNLISQVLIVIVLTLLAIWLWKQIKRKER